MTDFADIQGQSRAISRLRSVYASQRRPAAMIFAGTGGTGRCTTATAYAKLLLCENPAADQSQIDSCGKCRSCLMIEQGSHPDFHIVTRQLASYSSDARTRNSKQQSLSINVVREFLIDPANAVSNCGKGRVFIVDEAETLATEAQNALLKTLEEPPKNVTVILICSCQHDLLATIRSRCSLVRFDRLDNSFIAGKLADNDCGETEALYWSRFSDGSLGESLLLHSWQLYDFKCQLIQRIANGGDVDLADDMVKICDKLASEMASDNKNLADSVAKRQAGRTILQLICSAFSDAVALVAGSPRELINADQRSQIQKLSERFSLDQLTDAVEQMMRFEQLLWRNLNQKVLWDNVAISCMTAAPLNV